MEKGNQETAVLISIRPEWCEKIISGEKTVEVRKTRPKIEPPFKCYIYETMTFGFSRDILGREYYRESKGHGKVIGEFICKNIGAFPMQSASVKELSSLSLVKEEEIYKYVGKNTLLYGWYISDLRIYEDPLALKEFSVSKTMLGNSGSMQTYTNQLFDPPRSWCYVDERSVL